MKYFEEALRTTRSACARLFGADNRWVMGALLKGKVFRLKGYRPHVHGRFASFQGLEGVTWNRAMKLADWWGFRPATVAEFDQVLRTASLGEMPSDVIISGPARLDSERVFHVEVTWDAEFECWNVRTRPHGVWEPRTAWLPSRRA